MCVMDCELLEVKYRNRDISKKLFIIMQTRNKGPSVRMVTELPCCGLNFDVATSAPTSYVET